MRTLVSLILGLSLLLISSVPSSNAGVAIPGTPVAIGCVVADTDSCTATSPGFLAGFYVVGSSGVFEGTVSMTMTGGGVTRTQTCTGTLVGLLILNGFCTNNGLFPPGGVPLELTCDSVGTGVASCTAEGA